MSDTSDTSDNLGADGTIPNSPDGIAVGHDPDGSHFNPEEDDTPTSPDQIPDGSGTDTESSIDDDDDSDTASGGDVD